MFASPSAETVVDSSKVVDSDKCKVVGEVSKKQDNSSCADDVITSSSSLSYDNVEALPDDAPEDQVLGRLRRRKKRSKQSDEEDLEDEEDASDEMSLEEATDDVEDDDEEDDDEEESFDEAEEGPLPEEEEEGEEEEAAGAAVLEDERENGDGQVFF